VFSFCTSKSILLFIKKLCVQDATNNKKTRYFGKKVKKIAPMGRLHPNPLGSELVAAAEDCLINKQFR